MEARGGEGGEEGAEEGSYSRGEDGEEAKKVRLTMMERIWMVNCLGSSGYCASFLSACPLVDH